jgi:serine/threonine protein kinase
VKAIAGRFSVIAEVGAGGMGRVYKARDATTGGTVALKVLRDDAYIDPERFLREANVLAGLHHPGIVEYVAHGRAEDGALYLAMEWVEGETLSRRLDERGLTVAEAVKVVIGAARALAEAHRQRVLHRDLKPSNLLLAGGDAARVKVIDFGVARRLGDTMTLTKTGIAMGTPGYMAPEQARAHRDVDTRVDLFALGCILYECLAGAPAFSGDNVAAVMCKIIMLDPAPIRGLCPEAPAELAEVVDACLCKDPAGRPASADALAAALERLGPLPDARRRPVQRLTSVATVPATPRPRHKQLTSIVLGSPALDEAGLPEAVSAATIDDLRERLDVLGARLDLLSDGTLLAHVQGSDADDVATRAARAGLRMRAALPGGTVVLSTRPSADLDSVSAAIDEASRVLSTAALESIFSALAAGGEGDSVRIDDLTASLLPASFVVARDTKGFWLKGETA